MRTKLVLLASLALAAAWPLAAGHRHGRDCGHYYSRAHRGWVAVSVATPWGGGTYFSGRDRGYYDRGYYDRGYSKRGRYFPSKRAYKRYLKERKRYLKRARRHRHGRYCRH